MDCLASGASACRGMPLSHVVAISSTSPLQIFSPLPSWKEHKSLTRSRCSSSRKLHNLVVASKQREIRGYAACKRSFEFSLGLAAGLLSALPAMAIDPVTLAEECATLSDEFGGADINFIIVIACVLEFVALTGAFVGGVLARQRKSEVEKINTQLRQININLRKQARVESYAPTLSYAPVGTPSVVKAAVSVVQGEQVTVPSGEPAASLVKNEEKEEILQLLRGGKKFLREQNPARAFVEFEKALELAKKADDHREIKKALRGLGASSQRERKYQEAIKYHQMVIDTSNKKNEHGGDVEAIGAIADCYTELGDLENAAKFYDKYISMLQNVED